MIDDCNVTETDIKKDSLPRYVNWKKLSKEHLTLFQLKMAERLALLRVHSHEFVHGDGCCLDDTHKISLENYYSDIVSAIIYAESFMPKTDPNVQRSFWNEELSDLKNESITCNNYWKSLGSPKSGAVYECRKTCHYRYKSALRKQKAEDVR